MEILTANRRVPSRHSTPVDVKAYWLPQLDEPTVRLSNHAYATPACRLRRGRILVWQATPNTRAAGRLRCRLGRLTFFLACEGLADLEPQLKGFEFLPMPEASLALLEHALAPVLELIETLAGQPVTCEAYEPIDALGQHGPSTDRETDDLLIELGFALQGTPDDAGVRGWMRAPLAVWRGIDFARTPPIGSARHEAVPVRLSILLGHSRLMLSELRDLEAGDALRVAPMPSSRDPDISVQLVDAGQRRICSAKVTGEVLTLTTTLDRLMDDPHVPAGSIDTTGIPDNARVSSIECDLTFELGSIRMTLAEIGKLRAGQSIRLGVRVRERPVRILVSGQQIARGELAAIGDELVVVVTDTNGLPNL